MPSRIASDDHLCGTADNAGRVPGAHGGTGDILLDPRMHELDVRANVSCRFHLPSVHAEQSSTPKKNRTSREQYQTVDQRQRER